MRRSHPHRTNQGFSLIELVIVLVVMSVIGVGLVSLYTGSIQQYLDATRRAEMTASARLALERMGREIRNALPNSVRVSSDNNCVEFRPILTGALYSELPTTSAGTTITASAFTLPAGNWSVSVMPLLTSDGSASDMYGSAPLATAGIASVSAPDSNNQVTITLTAAHRFPRTSPTHRLFVVGSATSFCVSTDGAVRRYQGYASTVVQPLASALSNGQLLAEHVRTSDTSNSVFRYFPGSLERNAVLDLSLLLQLGDESLRYAHEVQIRNVP